MALEGADHILSRSLVHVGEGGVLFLKCHRGSVER